MGPVKNPGELRWYLCCFCEKDWNKGVLKLSQQTFADQLTDGYGLVHWRLALGILEYVRRTSSFEIPFQKGTVGSLS